MKKWEIVWWWALEYWTIGCRRYVGAIALIYDWWIQIGPLEIRRKK